MLNWRWYLFWIRDFCQGGKVYEGYRELKESSGKLVKETQEEKIKKLIKQAKENTEFYSEIKSDNITDFPVINKATIKENYDKFVAKNYIDKNLHKMSTSGSTGTPFTVIQNSEKRSRVLAELIYYNKEIGFSFGEKQVFFRVWTEKNKKTKLQKFLQNLVPIDISDLSEENLKIISEKLKKDKKIKNILSYASTLDELSKFMIENGYKSTDFSVSSIISGSEILQDETRRKLKNVFKCNVISRYSNQENGILAQEYIDSKNMRLNNTNYYIEFLKQDSDEEAEEGEVARVVITDLYNYAIPMIRYDTGDLAIYKNDGMTQNDRVITEIFGRRVDSIYDTKGNIVSPHAITNNMWGLDKVKQFKFQQLNYNGYKIILNKEKDVTIQERELIDKIKKIVGIDANIMIEYVDEIPILASGKRKYIENLYKK